MHLLPERFSESTGRVIRQLVAKTAVTAVEADVVGFSEPSFARFGNGVVLSSVAPTGLYQATVATGEHFGIEEADLASCKPWWAALRLVVHALVEIGFVPAHGVDEMARQASDEAGHGVVPLEPPERGLRCLDVAPLEEQLLSLELVTRRQAEGLQMFSDLAAAWLSGSRGGAWQNPQGAPTAPARYHLLFRRAQEPRVASQGLPGTRNGSRPRSRWRVALGVKFRTHRTTTGERLRDQGLRRGAG